jgi:Cupredoxin-like domain
VTRILVAGLAALLLAVPGCSDRESGGPTPSPSPTGPYVVTAIDYHFHDAHPSLPIAMDRTVEINNQGSNIHNVTFEGLDYSETVRPGRRLAIDPAELFGTPGRYPFVCRFHVDRGMTGVLVIVA